MSLVNRIKDPARANAISGFVDLKAGLTQTLNQLSIRPETCGNNHIIA